LRTVPDTDGNGNCNGDGDGNRNTDAFSITDAYGYYSTSKDYPEAETSADSAPAPVVATLTCPP
jgi:hypothetical protein